MDTDHLVTNWFTEDGGELLSAVKLFKKSLTPEYLVVVGRLNEQTYAFIKVSGASNKRFPGLRGRMAAIGFVRIAPFVDHLLRFLHQPRELMQLDTVQIGYGPIVHT